jgi:YegS/Rv2252/BmrU family lipid kinase
MKTCAIVYNPISGKKINFRVMPQFEKILAKHGYETKIFYTKYKGHATEIVRDLEPVDLVISIGGDGTFNESVTGNFMREKKLVCAHIPCGTTNDIGMMMGYGKNMISNLKATLNGVVKNIDICMINNKPFVYVAAIGKFTDIPYETPRKLKKNIGYLAYLSEGVKSFFNKTRLNEIVYEVNGETHRGLFSFIIISSASRISGINNFYKDVKLDDNKFEVMLCNISKKADIIKSLYFLTLYDVSKVPGIYSYKTDNFKIQFIDKPKKPWCVDGEKLDDMGNKYEITIDRSLKMMIPTKNIDKLFKKK